MKTVLLRTCTAATFILAAATLSAQTAHPPSLPPETAAPATAPPATAAPASQLPDSPLPNSPGVGAQPAGAPAPEPTGPTVIMDTSMGRLTCKLFDKQAPLAAANFIGLANGTKEWTDPTSLKKVKGQRFYDGTTFHRVIPAFMIQGGDRRGDGTGDAGYFFDNEVLSNLTFDVPGRLAMANAGPNTNGTQFFVTELPQPDLDGKYTIFGQCDAHSVLIVATIARVDRNSQDKPLTPVALNKVTIVPAGEPIPPEPTAASAPAAASGVPALPPPR